MVLHRCGLEREFLEFLDALTRVHACERELRASGGGKAKAALEVG